MEREVRLEVITEIGVFVLTSAQGGFDEYDHSLASDFSDTVTLLAGIVADIKAGCAFDGWTPYQNPDTDPAEWVIIENDIIKAFRLYYIDCTNTEETNADATPTRPYPFTCFSEYLGNKITIEGIACKTPKTEYLLPTYVNGYPAAEYLKAPSILGQLVRTGKEAAGVSPEVYTIVATFDAPRNYDAAADYLIDYINEVEPMTKVDGVGKATAWNGWKQQ